MDSCHSVGFIYLELQKARVDGRGATEKKRGRAYKAVSKVGRSSYSFT